MKLAGKRLLFVDDERGIRETLSVILLRYGFKVTLAATVKEAVEQIKAQEFDLLLCDLNIERERDGYTVVRAMREANPNSAIVILTGYPDIESAEQVTRLGADDYIAKPADANILVALLADRLAARERRSAETSTHVENKSDLPRSIRSAGMNTAQPNDASNYPSDSGSETLS
jgi:two-component system response regulator HydG